MLHAGGRALLRRPASGLLHQSAAEAHVHLHVLKHQDRLASGYLRHRALHGLGQIDGVTGTGMFGFILFRAAAGAAAPDAVAGGRGGKENAPIKPASSLS